MEVRTRDKPRRLRRFATKLSGKILKIKLALSGDNYRNKDQLREGSKFLSEECVSSHVDGGSQEQDVESTATSTSTSVEVAHQPETVSREPDVFQNKDEMFTLFGQLPTELRLLIWRFALPGPRIVQLRQRALKTSPFILSGTVRSDWAISETETISRCKEESDNTAESDDTAEMQAPVSTLNPEDQRELDFAWRTNVSNLAGFTSTATAPSLLFVCHESHEVALERYTKAFGAHCALPTTWFDYRNDALHLSTCHTTSRSLYNLSQHNFLEEMLPRIFSTERALVENLVVDLHDTEDFDYTSAMWLGWIVVMFPNVKSLLYELPGFGNAQLPRDEGWQALRRREFEIAFADYREYGTLRYEVTGWKDYLEKEHGCKDLVIEERCLSMLREGGGYVGDLLSLGFT